MQIIFNNDNKRHLSLKPNQLKDMYQNIFLNTPEGQYIMDDLATKAGMFSMSKEGESLLYREGMRALYLYIASHLTDYDNKPTKTDNYKPII